MSFETNIDKMKINEELLSIQQEWQDKLYSQVFDDYKANESEKGKLSCAFSFGVSDRYLNSEKKVMIVGQEAKGHTTDYQKWGLKNMQEWALAYLEYQVYGEESLLKNKSPFWNFVRLFKSNGYGICWNNIDKVRRYIPVNEGEWQEDFLLENNDEDKIQRNIKDRSILNEKIFNGKSLLQKEIEIAKPDVIVFAIGPTFPYYHALCLAFFDDSNVDCRLSKRNEEHPYIKGNYCCNISKVLGLDIPAYYTYHPNCLNRNRVLDKTVDDICCNKT